MILLHYKKDEKDPPLAPKSEPYYRDGWFPKILLEDYEALNDKECDFNQQDIARILGKSTSNISQYLKLLRLPPSIQSSPSTQRNGSV